MDMQAAFRDDYATWDNVESVLFESARKADGPKDAFLAKRRALTTRELAASGGGYTSLDVVWIVPAAVVPDGFRFKPADTITETTDDATAWTVLEAQWGKSRNTWRLTCRDPIIAFDLQDLVTIQVAASSYDAAGVTVRTWSTLYANVACKVQPLTKEAKDERAMRGQQIDYEIHFAKEIVGIDVRENRIVWGALTLDLVEYSEGNRIDVLPTLTAALKV